MTDPATYIGEIARRVLGEPNQRESTDTQLRFGTHGSVAVEIGGPKAGNWFDQENNIGGGWYQLLTLKGGIAAGDVASWLEREFGIKPEPSKRRRNIVAEYNYTDEHGKLLFQVVRLDPKDFRQRRPDGVGGWIWKLDGVRRVPYRLPELAAARNRRNGTPWRVYICEGEKDADRLAKLGVIATTSPGGASNGNKSKWIAEYNQYFTGADVVIIPDNDPAGQNHAHQIARSVGAAASNVRIVELPGLNPGGDVSDWLDAVAQ
jgi:putative DNA primase/helicase